MCVTMFVIRKIKMNYIFFPPYPVHWAAQLQYYFFIFIELFFPADKYWILSQVYIQTLTYGGVFRE